MFDDVVVLDNATVVDVTTVSFASSAESFGDDTVSVPFVPSGGMDGSSVVTVSFSIESFVSNDGNVVKMVAGSAVLEFVCVKEVPARENVASVVLILAGRVKSDDSVEPRGAKDDTVVDSLVSSVEAVSFSPPPSDVSNSPFSILA